MGSTATYQWLIRNKYDNSFRLTWRHYATREEVCHNEVVVYSDNVTPFKKSRKIVKDYIPYPTADKPLLNYEYSRQIKHSGGFSGHWE